MADTLPPVIAHKRATGLAPLRRPARRVFSVQQLELPSRALIVNPG